MLNEEDANAKQSVSVPFLLELKWPKKDCKLTNLFVPQDVSWFDNPKNTTGALTTRLANDAAQVKGVRACFLWVVIPMLF